jgi:hypothetical protein
MYAGKGKDKDKAPKLERGMSNVSGVLSEAPTPKTQHPNSQR